MSKKGKGKFFLGALVGAGLGLLFAPKKGSATRRDLKVKIDEVLNYLKGVSVDELKADIETKVLELKAELAELDKEKVLSLAKKKGKELKKKSEELVELALQKGTPVLSKMVEEVRDKTVAVANETIKKLEDPCECGDECTCGEVCECDDNCSCHDNKTAGKKVDK